MPHKPLDPRKRFPVFGLRPSRFLLSQINEARR